MAIRAFILGIFLIGVANFSSTTLANSPVFKFDAPQVRDWLVIGPLPRGEAPPDPFPFLNEPVEGNAVTFPNGQVLTWTRASTDEDGNLKLDSFCESQESEYSDKVVYASAILSNEEKDSRQLFFGHDDGARIWIDGQLVVNDLSSGHQNDYEWQGVIDFGEQSQRDLLAEYHNYNGKFSAKVSAGYTLRIKAVRHDQRTPIPHADVKLEGDGFRRQLKTNTYGQAIAFAVPYGKTVSCSGLGNHYLFNEQDSRGLVSSVDVEQIKWNEFLVRTPPRPFIGSDPGHSDLREETIALSVDRQFRRSSINDLLPEGCLIAAMAEDRSGRILLALENARDTTIYRYDGHQINRHPDKRLHDLKIGKNAAIVTLHLDREGTIWIGTEGDGVYAYLDSIPAPKHWTREELCDQPFLLHQDSEGVIWFAGSVSSSVDSSNISDNYRLFRFGTFPDYQLEEVSLPSTDGKFVVRGLVSHKDVGTFILRSSSLHRYREGQLHDCPNPPERINNLSAAIDEHGTLWATSHQNLYSYTLGNGWKHVATFSSALKRDPIRMSYNCGMVVAAGRSRICVYDQKRSYLQEHTIDSKDIAPLMSSSGRLYLADIETGLQEVRFDRFQEISQRDGILGEIVTRVQPHPEGVVISSHNAPPAIVRDGSFRVSKMPIDDPSPDKSAEIRHYLSTKDDGVYSAFQSFVSMEQLSSTVMPFLRDHSSQTWSQAGQPSEWAESKNSSYFWFYFCKRLRSGRVLVGANTGLCEIQGDQLIWCPSFENSKGLHVDTACETENGDLWIALNNVFTDPGPPRAHRIRKSDGKLFKYGGFTGTAMDMIEHNGCLYVACTSGLKRFNPDSESFERHTHPTLGSTSIVAFARSNDGKKLWIGTSREGVFAMDPEGELTRLVLPSEEPNQRLSSLAVDPSDRLWMCVDGTALSYEGSALSPLAFIASIAAGGEPQDLKEDQPIACAPDTPISVGVSVLDDGDQAVFQYRLRGEGEWKEFASGVTAATLDLRSPASDGQFTVELRCVDPDFNVSSPVYVPLKVYTGFWDRASVRYSLVGSVTALLALVVGMVVVHDRTRAGLIDQEISARKSAEMATRERETLLARVSHDLKNPLAAICLCFELYSAPDNERVCKINLKETFEHCLQNLTYLTNQLISFSKSLSTEAEKPQLVDMRHLLDRIGSTVQMRFHDSKVEFITIYGDDVPACVLVNEWMLVELINNLIDNAYRYTDEGSVTLSYRKTENHDLLVSVADTGIGISSDDLKHVTEDYVQGTNKRSAHQSMGLGLGICRRLARKLDANLTFDSTLGEGTTVLLQLPSSIASEDEIPTVEKRRIVIIDDEPAFRTTLAAYLIDRGHEVMHGDEKTSSHSIRLFKPHFVLLDLAMPEKSGFEIARELAAELPGSTRIAAMSAAMELCHEAKQRGEFHRTLQKSGEFMSECDAFIRDPN